MAIVLGVLAGLAALTVAWFAGVRKLLNRTKTVARSTIRSPEEHTTRDADGAVTSTQSADLTLPVDTLDDVWTPAYLERLAATYWRYLSRCTLGIIRVLYEEDGRRVVVLIRPLTLLRFHKPEYEMDDRRGIVRWRIRDGILVARAGVGANGFLEIDVERCDPADDEGRLHIEVEVANFYPRLGALIYWFYANTQSRIHVLVTHGFLRSLARMDLAESVAGTYADRDDVPDPPPPGEKSSGRATAGAA